MNIATRIDEFTPSNWYDVDGTIWLSVDLKSDDSFKEYDAMPNIVEYDGKRFYKMSYNTDKFYVAYKESKGYPYHLRYQDY